MCRQVETEELVTHITDSLERLSIEFLMPRIVNTRFAIYKPFKLSAKRTICYVMISNRAVRTDRFNLGIRIKRLDSMADWQPELDDLTLFNDLRNSFILPFSRERGYPPHTIDNSTVTQQVGLTISVTNVEHPAFTATIDLLLAAAHAAVTRRWDDYSMLTCRTVESSEGL